MVGGGIFEPEVTARTMGADPARCALDQGRRAAFEPANNALILDGCRVVRYNRLIVAPGLKLDWDAIEGLVETLGRNGVTSNYRYDLAPYTWEAGEGHEAGKAIFTQPPMPIKCAGAPQKALYLSGDHWYKSGVLKDIDIEFCNAGGVLFGVKDYVPALEEIHRQIQRHLSFMHNLVRIDGPAKKAWFEVTDAGYNKERIVEKSSST
jgi:sulfide:quinone oxidoreductase